MSNADLFKQGIAPFLPAAAVDGICDYMIRHKVQVTATNQRTTKLGDYRLPSLHHPNHAISFNGDLNPYMALHVLLHEMAHLDNYLLHGRTVAPHGLGWQECFRHQMMDFRHCYPIDALPLLDRYTARIPLNKTIGIQLEECLKSHTPGYSESHGTTLNDLMPDTRFQIVERPGITFRAIARRRTRWLCEDTATHNRYTISGTIHVTPIP